MVSDRLTISEERLSEFCRLHSVKRLALFGSVLRDDFGPESDVDFLVEFKAGRLPSLIGMAELEADLSGLIGRKADLRTARELSRRFRDEVLAEAEERYVAT